MANERPSEAEAQRILHKESPANNETTTPSDDRRGDGLGARDRVQGVERSGRNTEGNGPDAGGR